MGLSLKKLGKDITSVLGGVERQVNPFDNGASYSNPRTGAPPVQHSVLNRAFDQINPLDNGRTFKHSAPTNNRSILEQFTHNALTNNLGNLAYKPITSTIPAFVIEPARSAVADITHNKAAMQAAEKRKYEALDRTIPGYAAHVAFNTGKLPVDLVRQSVGDLTNNPVASRNANTAVLKDINSTPIGQVLNIAERNLADYGARKSNPNLPKVTQKKIAAQALENVGVDPNASLGKQLTDTAVGGLQIAGVVKGSSLPSLTDKLSSHGVQSRFADQATRYLQATVAQASEAAAKSTAKTKEGMAAVSKAEAGANFGKDLNTAVNADQKLLEAPKQNFTIQRVEDKRIMAGTNKLADEYSKRYDDLVRVWGRAPNRLKVEVSKLDDEFLGRHDNLINGVGEFTAQTPKPKVTLKTPKQPESYGLRVIKGKESVKPTATLKEPVKLPDLEPLSPYTGTPKSPNAFARAWLTVNGVISRHGTAGREIARRNGEWRNQSERAQQEFLDRIPTVGKLSKNDFTTFVQSLGRLDKGEKIQVAPHIQQAIKEWNEAIPTIRDRGVAAKLDIGDLGANYFPRQYKDLFSSDQALSRMAEQMVHDGKATTLGDAMGKLRFMKNEYQRPYGNLEKTREFDLPGYEMTHEAMTNYISRAFDRITKAEQFGPKNEILNHLQGRAQEEGYNAAPGSTLDKYIKIALGDVDKNTVAHKVSGGVRKVNALRSLSTAGLSNATQLTNTATIAGIGKTVKGIAKLAVSPRARAEAREAGVLLDHAIAQLSQQGLGTGGAITRNVASPFFRQVERFNRQATAIVGKDYGNHLAKKGDVTQLREKFGVTGDIGKTLTREQEIQVSRALVEKSQFKVDPMDLPGWVDSPMGKLVAQFRTFGYKQSDFMYNQVLREAVKGNFLPLARFTALSIPLGTATLAAKGAIKGTQYTQPDEGQASKTAKAVAAVGGFGLPGSEGQNIYKSNQYGNTPAALAGVVGGPTASLLTETATNIGDKGLSQKNWTPLEKEGVRSIPAVGPSVANRVFPKKTSTKTTAPGSNSNNPDLKSLKDSPPTGYYLQKTSDGVYAYTLNDGKVHSTSNLKDAQGAVARDIFGKSDQNIKVVGDKVYRKSANGAISVITKDSYDYQLGTAKLTSYKKSGDVKGWMETANSQLTILQKELDDPNTDPLDAIKYQNQAQAILDDMDKYQGYGGFTKPKSGSGGSAGSPYKYAVSLSSGGQPKRPKVSVRSAGSAPKARRGTSKPKVSLKASKV